MDTPHKANFYDSILVYFRPKMLMLMFLGFSCAIPLPLTGSTLNWYLSEFGIGVSTIGMLSILGLPYALKFFWSPLLDHLPLPILSWLLGQRRSWILFTQVIIIFCVYMLAQQNPETDIETLALWVIVLATASASQDIAVDAYRVELLEDHEQGAGAAMYVMGYRIGFAGTAAAMLYLVDYYQKIQDFSLSEAWMYAYHAVALSMVIGIIAVLLSRKTKREYFKSESKEKGGKNQPDHLDDTITELYHTIYDGEEDAATKPALMINEDTRINQEAQKIAYNKRFLMMIFFFVITITSYKLWEMRSFMMQLLVFEDVNLYGYEVEKLALGKPFYWLYYLLSSFLAIGLLVSSICAKPLKYVIIAPFHDLRHHHSWFVVLLFVILYKLGDALAGSVVQNFIFELDFSRKEYATIVKIYGMAATIIGAMLGGMLVYYKGVYVSLWIGGILQMLSNLMYANLAYYPMNTQMLASTIIIEDLSGGLGSAAFVAYLSMLCNREFSATQYAFLSSIANAGRTYIVATLFFVDSLIFENKGSFVTEIGWTNFFIITTVAAIPGLLMLSWLSTHKK